MEYASTGAVPSVVVPLVEVEVPAAVLAVDPVPAPLEPVEPVPAPLLVLPVEPVAPVEPPDVDELPDVELPLALEPLSVELNGALRKITERRSISILRNNARAT